MVGWLTGYCRQEGEWVCEWECEVEGDVVSLTHPKVTTNAKHKEMAKAMPAVSPCGVVKCGKHS